MTKYSEKFWKSSWDSHVSDIDPSLWDTSFPDSMKEIFQKFPDKVALAFQGKEFTYKQLDEWSNQFAQMLVDKGFEKGDIVGINLANIPEYVISVLGTQKAGCIVSGISPLLSDVQMHYQINDLGAGKKKVCLVTLNAIFEHRLKGIAHKLPDLKVVVVTSIIGSFSKEDQDKVRRVKEIPWGEVTPLEGKDVIDYWDDMLANYPKTPVDVKVSGDDLAFIQYTGGTTGPPKGAQLTHKNAVSDVVMMYHWLQWEQGVGVALSGFPFFHIAGLFFCECCLYLGWTQVLIPDPRDTLTICNEIKKYKPTVLANVPALFQLLLATRKFKRLDHSNLDIVVSGAAPFPVESQEQLEAIIGENKIMEVYGMTETAPLSASNPYKGEKRLGSIGVPFPNTEVKLTDPETGEEVPIGQPGEICVKGPQVMQGYHNKPEETAKALDADGFMHTGDVAIMDEKGYMRIVDRTKDMIIVSGFKVFSAKLEDTLTKHPAIEMVATVGIPNPDRPGSEIVKAFVQLDPKFEYDGNEDALKESITAFAKENCSPYEVPKLIEISKELPLTTVGKIDKKVLRK